MLRVLLILHAKMTTCSVQGLLGIKPGFTKCKAGALHTPLSLVQILILKEQSLRKFYLLIVTQLQRCSLLESPLCIVEETILTVPIWPRYPHRVLTEVIPEQSLESTQSTTRCGSNLPHTSSQPSTRAIQVPAI